MILDQLSHYTLQITKGKDEHEHEHDVGCSASINIITKPTPVIFLLMKQRITNV